MTTNLEAVLPPHALNERLRLDEREKPEHHPAAVERVGESGAFNFNRRGGGGECKLR